MRGSLQPCVRIRDGAPVELDVTEPGDEPPAPELPHVDMWAWMPVRDGR